MPDATSPSSDALYATAELQAGYFTTAQGAEAGSSPQLLYKYLEAGRLRRVRRGVYRLVHFPMSDDAHLVECWLWAEQAGVFSHETALFYHDLSNVLPKHVPFTVPEERNGESEGSRCPGAWCSTSGTSRRRSAPGSARSRSRNRRGPSATSSTPTSPRSTSSDPSPMPTTAVSSTGTRPKPAFELRDLGAFPGLVRGGERVVAGEVCEVDEATLAAHDRLEGHPRFYRRTRIALADGAAVETYLLAPGQVEGRPVIDSGNWRARRKETAA